MVSSTRMGILTIVSVLTLLLISPTIVTIDNTLQAQVIDDRLLSAFVFMNTSCVDFTYGGHYQKLDRSGTPISKNKILGIEGWIIRGSLEYYNYSWDTQALTHAIDTFNTIEAKMRNPSHTYNARMVEDWSSTIIGNSRTADNSHLIRALVELYKFTGNASYYQTAAWLMYFIRDYHRNIADGGYHIEVDGFGNPNLTYYPYGYLPGLVALACTALLSVDPTNATFLDELNYALNFANTVYWDSPYGGYCYTYTPEATIYQNYKPLHMQSLMMQAFIAGYLFTANMTYRNHAIEIANLIRNHWTDSNLGYVTHVTQTLSVLDSNRNSAYLAQTANAFLDLYHITGNTTYRDSGVDAMDFIMLHHYDPAYLGYYAKCDAAGNPVDTTKHPSYQSDILSAMTRYDFGDHPPPTTTNPPTTTTTPTTPTDPSLRLLQTLTIIEGTVIIVLVSILVLIVLQQHQKSRKHLPSVKSPQPVPPIDSHKPQVIRFCKNCGGRIEPEDRYCASCGRSI